VPSPWPCRTLVALLIAASTARAAVVPPEESIAPDRARDQTQMVPTNDGLSGPAATDGLQYSPSDNAATDDSFGRQIFLKPQERVREFLLTGDASIFFTSNAALTKRDTINDVFFVTDAAIAWTRAINQDVRFQLGGHLSLFRYNDTPSLDFDNIGGGLGLIWTPQFASGIAVFARYDATKLLHRDGNDLLTDHEFTLGAEKIVVLGRSHFLSFSVGGAVGITDPHAAQRDLLGTAMAYHLRLARNLDLDVSYRLSGYFYNAGGRDDLNQLGSVSLTYYFCRWASVSAFGSYSLNRSNHSIFDYDVGAGGGGILLSAQF
jgi:hypothetical protein